MRNHGEIKDYKTYAKAIRRSKRLYKRLSSYTNIHSIDRNFIKLIKNIKEKYRLHIKMPKDIYVAIEIGESLFENDELRAKLSKEIKKSGSPIENKLAEYLDSENIKYVREYHIGRYRVDFMIPSKKLIIECMGYAWHQDPKTYQEMEKDLRRRNELAKAGFSVLYYSGRQIYRGKTKILKDISLF